MASKPADLPNPVWAPSTSPLRIEYAPEVMEEVRARAVEGFYKLMRGGVEVAGVLLGEQRGDYIRILAQHPFEIEYAFGPVFQLSARDVANLRKFLEDLRATDAENGLRVLGFYVSHSRNPLALLENELSLFADLFPHQWQTVLLLKPSRAPETPAAFFVREPDGNVRANRSHQEFELMPLMGAGRRAARATDPSLRALADASSSANHAAAHEARLRAMRRSAEMESGETASAQNRVVEPVDVRESALVREREAAPAPPLASTPRAQAAPPPAPSVEAPPAVRPPVAAPPQPPPPALRQPKEEPLPSAPEPRVQPAWEDEAPSNTAPRATNWLRWAIPSLALLLLAVLGYLVYQALNSAPPTVLFYTKDSSGRLEVVWQLKGLSDATSAVITLDRNGERKTIDLMEMGQLSGTLTDPLLTPETKVFLDVQRASAPPIHRAAAVIPADSPVASLDESGLASSQPAGVAETNAEAPVESETRPAPDLAISIGTGAAGTGSAATAPAEAARTTASVPPADTRSAQTSPANSAPAPSPVKVTMLPPPAAPVARTEAPVIEPPSATAREVAQRGGVGNRPLTELPQRSAVPPAVANPTPALPPPPAASQVQPAAPAAKPAAPARVRAGRMIWTGQLKKNQSLVINGSDASMGVVNSKLPGSAVRISVLPGELTPQGLVVYSANPRHQSAEGSVEPPGPNNGWNQTRYRYDPARANSVVVTAIPNSTNGWQAVTVSNLDKTVNVVVIDWQDASQQ